jgi:hypothetical protein
MQLINSQAGLETESNFPLKFMFSFFSDMYILSFLVPLTQHSHKRNKFHGGVVYIMVSRRLELWVVRSNPTMGRCYDHNFLRFSTIFGEKIGVFLKKPK